MLTREIKESEKFYKYNQKKRRGSRKKPEALQEPE